MKRGGRARGLLTRVHWRKLRLDAWELRGSAFFLRGAIGFWSGGRSRSWGTQWKPIPIDIEASQLIHWLKVESESVPSTFHITARRSRELKEISGNEGHLGDDEREDLTEVETIVTLEITPHANEGWLLSVIVEDELGPRVSNGGGAAESTGQVIDLGTFDKEFIRPGRGIVVAETRDPAAKRHIARLIEAVETNRHPRP